MKVFKHSPPIKGKWGMDFMTGAPLRKMCFVALNLECLALNLLLLDDELTQYYLRAFLVSHKMTHQEAVCTLQST